MAFQLLRMRTKFVVVLCITLSLGFCDEVSVNIDWNKVLVSPHAPLRLVLIVQHQVMTRTSTAATIEVDVMVTRLDTYLFH